jgi:alkanesulfonate monooxygenase SsuD/methylene tetrahydromethanopterin reductase-like flavin-dependent oxidoreductase (luciferase family)
VKFAVYLPNFGAFGDARTLAGLARDAEEAGWDGFFIWDHVARAFVTETVDPWVALAAIALQTERIRIGALVTPLARRRPWKLARETVSVDHLSGGRLVFGAGLGSAGGAEAEWRAFGEETDRRRRAEMLDEGLELLLQIWSGDPVSFEGRHHRVVTESFLPRPLQLPRIPVWLAASWPQRATLRRAARFDGVFPLFQARPPDDLGELRALIAFVCEQRADDEGTFDVVHLVPPRRGDPSREAERIRPYADAGVTWWLERLTPDEFGAEWSGPWPFAAMRERILRGPPIVVTS